MQSHELITRFEAAASQWELEVEESDYSSVTHWGMIYTGGVWFHERVSKTSTQEMPASGHARINWSEIQNRHTLSQLIDRMTDLVENDRVDEELLVIGLVGLIDDKLEDIVEHYPSYIQQRREQVAQLRSLAEDHEFLERLRASEADGLSEESGAAVLAGLAEQVEGTARPTLDEMRARVKARDVWRSLTSSLLDLNFRREWRSRWYQQQVLGTGQ